MAQTEIRRRINLDSVTAQPNPEGKGLRKAVSEKITQTMIGAQIALNDTVAPPTQSVLNMTPEQIAAHTKSLDKNFEDLTPAEKLRARKQMIAAALILGGSAVFALLTNS